MPEILHRVKIRTSAQQVFRALSERSGLAGWWTKDVTASAEVGAIGQARTVCVYARFTMLGPFRC